MKVLVTIQKQKKAWMRRVRYIFGNISHPLLRERGTNNITSQILHSLLLSWLNSRATEDVEARMAPGHEHVDEILSDLAFGKKHLEDLVTEYFFQVLCVKTRRNSEHAVPIEAAI